MEKERSQQLSDSPGKQLSDFPTTVFSDCPTTVFLDFRGWSQGFGFRLSQPVVGLLAGVVSSCSSSPWREVVCEASLKAQKILFCVL